MIYGMTVTPTDHVTGLEIMSNFGSSRDMGPAIGFGNSPGNVEEMATDPAFHGHPEYVGSMHYKYHMARHIP